MFGLTYQFDDLFDGVCSQNITGVLLFQLFPNELSMIELATTEHTKSCWNYTTSHIHFQTENALTFLLYNAILAITATSRDKSSVDLENFRCLNNVYAYKISRNGFQNHLGYFDSSMVRMMANFCQEFSCAKLDLPIILKDYPLGYLLVLHSLCFIANTVFYVYFRNEPSVKSTSISLSLLLFLACYCLSLFTIAYIIHRSQKLLSIDLCTVHVWFNAVRLSMPLIFATLLVRMLRVYRIFTQFKVLKPIYSIYIYLCSFCLYFTSNITYYNYTITIYFS